MSYDQLHARSGPTSTGGASAGRSGQVSCQNGDVNDVPWHAMPCIRILSAARRSFVCEGACSDEPAAVLPSSPSSSTKAHKR